jgi:drug/metabolite transporter (DMT)-like permease
VLPAAAILERPWMLALPPAPAIAAVVALAIVCTALAMVIYFRLIRTLGPLGTTSGSYLRAGFAVMLGTTLLGESFTWSILAGMALILAGVITVTLPLPARHDQKPRG